MRWILLIPPDTLLDVVSYFMISHSPGVYDNFSGLLFKNKLNEVSSIFVMLYDPVYSLSINLILELFLTPTSVVLINPLFSKL